MRAVVCFFIFLFFLFFKKNTNEKMKHFRKAPLPPVIIPEPETRLVEEAKLHLDAAKASVKEAKSRVHELTVFEHFSPEERRRELENANKVVRAAEVQMKAADWACTYFYAFRSYDNRMRRYGADKLNEALNGLNSVPHESELWTNTYNLVAAMESVCDAKDQLDAAGYDKKKVATCRRALSLAIKAALGEANSFKAAASMIQSAEQREAVHKEEAASLKKELVNWKETVKALVGDLKRVNEELAECRAKKARPEPVLFVD